MAVPPTSPVSFVLPRKFLDTLFSVRHRVFPDLQAHETLASAYAMFLIMQAA
jgi:hypothetical protein